MRANLFVVLTWSKFHRERISSSVNGVSHSETSYKRLSRDEHTGILIALNGGGVTLKLDDLTHKLVPTDLHELIHL